MRIPFFSRKRVQRDKITELEKKLETLEKNQTDYKVSELRDLKGVMMNNPLKKVSISNRSFGTS